MVRLNYYLDNSQMLRPFRRGAGAGYRAKQGDEEEEPHVLSSRNGRKSGRLTPRRPRTPFPAFGWPVRASVAPFAGFRRAGGLRSAVPED